MTFIMSPSQQQAHRSETSSLVKLLQCNHTTRTEPLALQLASDLQNSMLLKIALVKIHTTIKTVQGAMLNFCGTSHSVNRQNNYITSIFNGLIVNLLRLKKGMRNKKISFIKNLFGKKRPGKPTADEALYSRYLMWENPGYVLNFFAKINSEKHLQLNSTGESLHQVNHAILGRSSTSIIDFSNISKSYNKFKRRYRLLKNNAFPNHSIVSYQVDMFQSNARVSLHFFREQIFMVELDLKYFDAKKTKQFICALFENCEILEDQIQKTSGSYFKIKNVDLYFTVYNNVGFRAHLVRGNSDFIQTAQEHLVKKELEI